MSNDLITKAANATTAVRNVCGIIGGLINLRMNNQRITPARILLLRESAEQAVALARIAGFHTLVTKARRNMVDSLEQIEKYRNTAIGDILLDSLRNEWESYGVICNCYLRLTGGVA